MFTPWLCHSYHLPSLFVNLSCKITNKPTLLPVDFKNCDFETNWRDLHAFISKVDLPVSSQYRSEKDCENIGIIIENKLINGLEINVEWFNHGFSVFKVCCGPRSILMPSASNPWLNLILYIFIGSIWFKYLKGQKKKKKNIYIYIYIRLHWLHCLWFECFLFCFPDWISVMIIRVKLTSYAL